MLIHHPSRKAAGFITVINQAFQKKAAAQRVQVPACQPTLLTY